MREYWLPALLSSELPTPSGRAIRMKLLGEKLIAFRSASGQVAVFMEQCIHAGVSLMFGSVEGDALRCSGHGWKYGLDGRCLEIPGEPPGSRFIEKVKQPTCPAIESGGIVWAYIRWGQEPPELPAPKWATLPLDQVQIDRQSDARNYLDVLDALTASSYVARFGAATESGSEGDAGPRSSPVGSFRVPFDPAPQQDADSPSRLRVWVPNDDSNTSVWTISWRTGTWRTGDPPA